MENKKSILLGIGAVLVIIAIILIVTLTGGKKDVDVEPVAQESVVGCYAMTSGKDRYTLSIAAQQGIQVSGTLEFKNFEKDSSHGTFDGTYEDGILFGKYSFMSEGMDSVMEVAFKKVGDTFVRGYGPVVNEGTQFASPDTITYEENSPLAVFNKTACSQEAI